MELEKVIGVNNIVCQRKVEKGWSGEDKYYLETGDGKKLLLRAVDIGQEEQKKEEFEIMKQFYRLGIPMSRPIAISVDPKKRKVYTVLSWLEGEDARSLLPLLPETDQYVLGLESGRYLKKMHSQHLLEGRPFCLQHGDYHVGNMIITGERKLGIIDFNRWDYGDPWEEFNRIIWSALVSPHFATG